MIPLAAAIKIRHPGHLGFRFWAPLGLLWLLLLPVALLFLPLVLAAGLVFQANPLRALSVFWQMLSATRGMRIETGHCGASFSIHIL